MLAAVAMMELESRQRRLEQAVLQFERAGKAHHAALSRHEFDEANEAMQEMKQALTTVQASWSLAMMRIAGRRPKRLSR